MTLRDGIVLVPLVLAILAFAVYPQRALDAGELAVKNVSGAVTSSAAQAR
jgi:NADH-quinone oxidoreductase subunit M